MSQEDVDPGEEPNRLGQAISAKCPVGPISELRGGLPSFPGPLPRFWASVALRLLPVTRHFSLKFAKTLFAPLPPIAAHDGQRRRPCLARPTTRRRVCGGGQASLAGWSQSGNLSSLVIDGSSLVKPSGQGEALGHASHAALVHLVGLWFAMFGESFVGRLQCGLRRPLAPRVVVVAVDM